MAALMSTRQVRDWLIRGCCLECAFECAGEPLPKPCTVTGPGPSLQPFLGSAIWEALFPRLTDRQTEELQTSLAPIMEKLLYPPGLTEEVRRTKPQRAHQTTLQQRNARAGGGKAREKRAEGLGKHREERTGRGWPGHLYELLGLGAVYHHYLTLSISTTATPRSHYQLFSLKFASAFCQGLHQPSVRVT